MARKKNINAGSAEKGTAPLTVPEPGDLVDVHLRITEGDKDRIQIFRGTVIAVRGRGMSKTFTVRRVSHGVGVERIFPLNAPVLTKLEIRRKSKVRRAKLYYLRDKAGREAVLKERKPSEQSGPMAVAE